MGIFWYNSDRPRTSIISICYFHTAGAIIFNIKFSITCYIINDFRFNVYFSNKKYSTTYEY